MAEGWGAADDNGLGGVTGADDTCGSVGFTGSEVGDGIGLASERGIGLSAADHSAGAGPANGAGVGGAAGAEPGRGVEDSAGFTATGLLSAVAPVIGDRASTSDFGSSSRPGTTAPRSVVVRAAGAGRDGVDPMAGAGSAFGADGSGNGPSDGKNGCDGSRRGSGADVDALCGSTGAEAGIDAAAGRGFNTGADGDATFGADSALAGAGITGLAVGVGARLDWGLVVGKSSAKLKMSSMEAMSADGLTGAGCVTGADWGDGRATDEAATGAEDVAVGADGGGGTAADGCDGRDPIGSSAMILRMEARMSSMLGSAVFSMPAMCALSLAMRAAGVPPGLQTRGHGTMKYHLLQSTGATSPQSLT